MQIPVTEFKAKCTSIFRDIEKQKKSIEITRRGKIIAIVQPPADTGIVPEHFLGCLHDTLTFHQGWQDPLGEDEWEVCK